MDGLIRSLDIDGAALVPLPADGGVWTVAEGQVEAYLRTPRLRRLIAVVGPGGQVYAPPSRDMGDAEIVLASSGGAQISRAEAIDRTSAAQWCAAHGPLDLPDDQPGLRTALASFHQSLERRFAEAEAAKAARLAQRLGDGQAAQARTPGAAAGIAWLAEQMAWPPPRPMPAGTDADFSVMVETARAMGLRARKITLDPDWPVREGPPMLLAAGEDIVPAIWSGKGWRLPSGAIIAAEDRNDFSRTAFAILRPFAVRPGGFGSMARFVWPDIRAALPMLVATALALGALGLALPVVTAAIFDDVVPSGDAGRLAGIAIALVAGALFTALFDAIEGLIRARINGQGGARLADALADHVLRLPETAFRSYAAGDFNQRLENIEQVRGLVTGLMLSSGVTVLTAIIYFALLFGYDVRLAALGLGLSLVSVALVAVGRVLQSGALREAANLDGKLAGTTYELLEAVAKLRTGAAEGRALDRWRTLYVAEQAASARGTVIGGAVAQVGDAYATVTMMALFAAIGLSGAALSPGMVLAFLAAFGVFQQSLIHLGGDVLGLLAAQPLIERGRAILDAQPEAAEGVIDPGTLTGAIELSEVVFGYSPDAPPLLSGLSLRVRPGEHVAIVGGSGSGKSTLLRLLLGFERPRAGSITFDGQELAQLDPVRVRSQIGVVLQSSMLFSGSLLENIRGASQASLEQCLDAADAAGLGPDLAWMGMGIHTPVTEGGGLFSGGQKQRVLIARALACAPRILFFDEATSALDNRTQAVVAQTLDGLDATRITIAHRLSTVRNADRICVLEGGRFVEAGTYDELMAMNGAFAALARRQLSEE